ncbi:hypothetical protein ZIOFF_066471 [Zingiber officinale]|uniref:Centromere protein S n=1 Tax=Zingiber officinale TaxID=94328 RepID=A0A8J5EYD9_ZINOF|nr:hypothetical protein ZIOFF_066471 [Zingiber officinale]
MESGDDEGDGDHFDVLKGKDPEAEERAELLKDRFRLSVISIATSEAKKVNMEVAEPVVACIADLAFKYTGGLSNPCMTLLLLFKSSSSLLRMASGALTEVSETTDILKVMMNAMLVNSCEIMIDSENEHVISSELGFEQLARDVELFAHHGGRKSVKMEDVILSAHRNEHLASLLRTYSQELKGKQLQNESKKKRSSKKDDKEIRD